MPPDNNQPAGQAQAVASPIPTTAQTPAPAASTFFGVDPAKIANPQGQTFYKAWTNASQNPDSPLATQFRQGVESGQYNDMATAAGIDLSKYPTVFKSYKPDQNAQDEQAINENLKEGKIKAPDAVIQDFGQAAKETNDALLGSWSPLGWVSKGINAAAQGIGNALSPVAEGAGRAVGGAARAAVGAGNADKVANSLVALVNSPIGQALKAAWGNPAVEGDLKAVGNVANLGATTALAGQGAEAMGDVGEAAANPETPIGKATQGVKSVTDAIGSKAQEHYVNAEKADWAKPTESPMATYNKANAVFEKAQSMGHDIPETLVKNGIKISDNIEGGRYTTAPSAEQIRDDAGTASRQILRPSLQMADYRTPPTPVDEIKVPEKSIQEQGRGVTPDDMEKIKIIIDNKLKALKNKYPDGIGLTNMHDERITYSQNGKYSRVNDPAVDNNAIANRSIASVLKEMVTDKAPEDLKEYIKPFQEELQKQYQAADYLDELDGKKVPRTILSSVANYAGKYAGLGIANKLGGGLLGDVAGYHLGGLVENVLENMPDPIRGHFLNNLEMTNPKAFDAIKNFIGEEKAAQLQRRMLPAAQGSATPNVIRATGKSYPEGKTSGVPYEGDKPVKSATAP